MYFQSATRGPRGRMPNLSFAVALIAGVMTPVSVKGGPGQRYRSQGGRHRFNYDNIVTGKQMDIELQAGDAIYVPPGGAPRPGPGMLDLLGAFRSASLIFRR